MAHHIFRRCVLADVVPPPVPPVFDDRIDLAASFGIGADGVDFGTSVAGLETMAGFLLVPIPPGVDTGDSRDRVAVLDRSYPPSITFTGLDLWGSANPGGIQ